MKQSKKMVKEINYVFLKENINFRRYCTVVLVLCASFGVKKKTSLQHLLFNSPSRFI